MQWSRAKLTLLLGLIFLVNFVETKSEPELTHVYNDRPALTLQLAQSMHHLENDLSFESQWPLDPAAQRMESAQVRGGVLLETPPAAAT